MENDQNKKYKLIKRIGEGASGKAFLVENTAEKTPYVIKTIYVDQMNEEEMKDAYIEAHILEKLDHPNIIKFKESYFTKKPKLSLCIIMEYADGGDLKTRIAEQKGKFFEENLILDWFTQICLALKHIHDRKILHRDLKSGNIFLSKNGLVKLGDFGIAKCLNYTMDKANTYIGTPYYLSPEIVQNQDYSFKSDIWSLGVLLYEIVCLKVPFEANNLATLSLKIIKGAYTPIPSHFSKELKNLVASLLNVDHVKRPNINQILKYPIIKSRIKNFLGEVDYNSEFSHTILHNFNPMKRSSNVTKNSKNMLKDTEIIINREKRVFSSAQAKKPAFKDNSAKHSNNNSGSGSGSGKKTEIFQKKATFVTRNKEASPTRAGEIYKSAVSASSKMDEGFELIKNSNQSSDLKKLISEVNKVTIDISKPSSNVISNNRVSDPNKLITVNDLTKNYQKKAIQKKTHSLEAAFHKENKLEEEKSSKKNENSQKLSEMLKSMNKKVRRRFIKYNQKPKNITYSVEINEEQTRKQTNPFQVATATASTIAETITVTEENNDIKDYLNSHKMLVELDEIQRGVLPERASELKPSINKENFNINDVIKDEYIDTKNDVLKTEENDQTAVQLKKNEDAQSQDFSHIEAIRQELETLMGGEVFGKVYKIVDESIPENSICYNHEVISRTIIKELMGTVDSSLVLISIDKIPEFYSLVLKERELALRKKSSSNNIK